MFSKEKNLPLMLLRHLNLNLAELYQDQLVYHFYIHRNVNEYVYYPALPVLPIYPIRSPRLNSLPICNSI